MVTMMTKHTKNLSVCRILMDTILTMDSIMHTIRTRSISSRALDGWAPHSEQAMAKSNDEDAYYDIYNELKPHSTVPGGDRPGYRFGWYDTWDNIAYDEREKRRKARKKAADAAVAATAASGSTVDIGGSTADSDVWSAAERLRTWLPPQACMRPFLTADSLRR